MPKNDDEKIGLINEVGDLGLGWTELSEEEQKVIRENDKEK